MKPLSDCTVLILEDDFGVGLQLMRALSDEGCRGVKLVRTVEGALRELAAATPDAATLDLDIRGKLSTLVADALAAHDVPFVTISSRSVLGAGHRRRPVCQKPVAIREVVSLLSSAISQRKAA
jgi:DNA-binding response OmpR family regulator